MEFETESSIQISKPNKKYNPYLEELEGRSRDITNQAFLTVSSKKTGHGVENLIDNNLDTFWQSNGIQPHLVNIQFKQKTKVKKICFHVDYKLDESYVPSKIFIKAGNHVNDLYELSKYELNKPDGWVIIDLGNTEIRTWMLQLGIVANHQNGKDTHIRQLKIHSPIENNSFQILPKFADVEISKWSCIR